MILPIAESISQLKWFWFWTARARPLENFQAFDSASRGPWGCLRMLMRPKLWHWSTSLGAAITIAALGVEPSLQQTLLFPSRLVVQPRNSTLVISHNFTDIGYDSTSKRNVVPSSPLKGILYSGIYDSSGGSSGGGITPTCLTGNCTWPDYKSLGVCSACADLTSRVHEDSSGGGWYVLSDDKNITISTQILQMQTWTKSNSSRSFARHLQNYTLVDLTMMVWPPGVFGSMGIPSPGTYECVLYFCIRSYSATMSNGNFEEHETGSWPLPNSNVKSSSPVDQDVLSQAAENPTYFAPALENSFFELLLPKDQLPGNTGTGQRYHVNLATFALLRNWLMQNLAGMVGGDQDSGDSAGQTDIIQALYSKSLAGGNEAGYMKSNITDASIAALPGLEPIMNNVAALLSTYMRNNGRAEALGAVYAAETYIKARWSWTILPLVLVVLTWGFAISTMFITASRELPIWKSSTLPIMLHGPDEKVCDDIVGSDANSLLTMEEHAQRLDVHMAAYDGSRWQLLSTKRDGL